MAAGLKWEIPGGYETILPIVDDFVMKENIPTMFIDNVIIYDQNTGEECLRGPPSFCCPHFHLLRRPYAELFKRGGIVSENDDCIAAITAELFLDGFLYTKEANSQIVQPLGGYWASPNLIGNRNWIWEFVMAPKNINRYSFGAKLESEFLDLTFFGENCNMWNPRRNVFEKGSMFCVPIRWDLDLKETHPMTGKIAGGGYCGCRLLCTHYDDARDYNSNRGWDMNTWLSGNVPRGNVT